jgi:hypothetical protein
VRRTARNGIRRADTGKATTAWNSVTDRVDILANAQSRRAKAYVWERNAALGPWRGEAAVRDFLHPTRTDLGSPSSGPAASFLRRTEGNDVVWDLRAGRRLALLVGQDRSGKGETGD